MNIKRANVYYGELSAMSYLWFLYQTLLRIVTLNFFNIKNKSKFLVNLLFLPLTLPLSPLIAFHSLQYYSDSYGRDPSQKTKFIVYGNWELNC